MPLDNRKRIAWACRRGMLELDILFISFLEHQFDALSKEEQALFVDLLTSSDQDLFDWCLQKKEPPAEYNALILRIIRGLVA